MFFKDFAAHVQAMPRIAVLLMAFIAVCSHLCAQSAALSGNVVDPSGGVVQGAEITLISEATNAEYKSTSNKDGIYYFSYVKPGKYTLRVDAAGFKRYERTSVTIETAKAVAVDVRLELGDSTQTISVDGSGIIVNTVNASVSTVVDRQFVENMPMNGRSFQSLISLVPGATVVPSSGVGKSGGISVNGQRTESNYFTVDGVSANTGAATGGSGGGAGFSGSTPGETVLGTTQSMISVDALQEFQATTSTFSAEHGRNPGGQFALLTRSGTNEWHGTAFNYLRNDALDANAWFNGYLNNPPQPKQPLRQNDFGGTLGGPVRLPGLYNGTDKTFFFFSYEGLRLRSPSPSQRYPVPSMRLRNVVAPTFRPSLDAFPLPDNPAEDQGGVAYFTSGYSAPSELDSSSLRLDHSFSSNFKVFGRWAYNPSHALTRGSNLAQVSRNTRSVQLVTLGATNILGPRFANDFRFNYTNNTGKSQQWVDDFGGATPLSIQDIPLMTENDWFGFYFFVGDRVSYAFTPNSSTQKQINIVDGFSAALGRHTLKFGFDYRRLDNYQTVPNYYQWSWAFDEDVMVNNNFDTVALYRYTMPVKPVYTNFSAYVQDEWKVNQRLSLSLGLRWDVNPPPNDADGNNPYTVDQIDNLMTTKLAPRGSKLWKTKYKNFAPRFGLAYLLRDEPSSQTVFRTGFGVFYDNGNGPASQGYTGIGSVYRYFTAGVFPATQAMLDEVPTPNVNTPYSVLVYGYDPDLQLPYTLQWNATMEQSFGSHQTLSVGYVGSATRRLTLLRAYDVGAAGNPNFAPGAASNLLLMINGAQGDYNSLQTKFQRRLSRGLQALLTYTWSHATDTATSNFQVAQPLKASSDYDIRHNFQAAVTYDLPGEYNQPLANGLLKHWSLDTRVMSRSGLPVDVNSGLTGIEGVGAAVSFHPNRVQSQPLYIYDNSFPGGRQINPAAFIPATDANGNNIEGDIGRNYARGFAAFQVDIAARREFVLTERFRLQFRAEAFNIANHPIFGSIRNNLNAGTDAIGRPSFGQAYQTLNHSLGGMNPLYQVGGPRSLQFSLKLRF